MKTQILTPIVAELVKSINYRFYCAKNDLRDTIYKLLKEIIKEQAEIRGDGCQMLCFDVDTDICVDDTAEKYSTVTGVLIQKDSDGDEEVYFQVTTEWLEDNHTTEKIVSRFFIDIEVLIGVWDSVLEMFGFDVD